MSAATAEMIYHRIIHHITNCRVWCTHT